MRVSLLQVKTFRANELARLRVEERQKYETSIKVIRQEVSLTFTLNKHGKIQL